jgi:hypothetical protein
MLQISSCPALTECETEIPVFEWKLAPRAGTNTKGQQNAQIELTEVSLFVKTATQRWVQQLEKCRPHHNQTEWLSTIRGIDVDTLQEDQVAALTAFSATCDLRGGETDNCSVDGHAVLATFVMLHSPRSVTVVYDGRVITKRLRDCNVWQFRTTRKMITYSTMRASRGRAEDHPWNRQHHCQQPDGCTPKLNLPLSGLKLEKAERLVRYHRILRETPTQARLACDKIVDDDELDDDVDCD